VEGFARKLGANTCSNEKREVAQILALEIQFHGGSCGLEFSFSTI